MDFKNFLKSKNSLHRKELEIGIPASSRHNSQGRSQPRYHPVSYVSCDTRIMKIQSMKPYHPSVSSHKHFIARNVCESSDNTKQIVSKYDQHILTSSSVLPVCSSRGKFDHTGNVKMLSADGILSLTGSMFSTKRDHRLYIWLYDIILSIL